ncbi:hypothetical protein QO014_002742 [Kaistia dalseonensis]|uniref:Uncharacterized protein n=1 Tax=Kaistia dalseonensis TaxID=410840 RepID=A0ABU0H7S0_9HYPH|nr:hypothetical protein [Kaistia dalseonensis]
MELRVPYPSPFHQPPMLFAKKKAQLFVRGRQ